MNLTNNLAGVSQRPSFTAAITTPGYIKLINKTLGDPGKAQRFIASISSAVAVNPQLQECEPSTILSAALLGESLNLPCSPQLGYFYMVPFKSKSKVKNGVVIEPECTKAQFQIGYKGYIQLAIRSGQYADIDVMNIKEGEYKGRDKETGKHLFEFIEDDEVREALPTIGYMAYLLYKGEGAFRKVVYWTKEKMINHADRYSQAFSKEAVKTQNFSKVSFVDFEAGNFPKADEWKYSSFWYKDFDTMAHKTLIRHLISKWGVMSVDFQDAYVKDMAVIEQDGTPDFVEAKSGQLPWESESENDTAENENGLSFSMHEEIGEISMDDI
jgi:recombination protein RecT